MLSSLPGPGLATAWTASWSRPRTTTSLPSASRYTATELETRGAPSELWRDGSNGSVTSCHPGVGLDTVARPAIAGCTNADPLCPHSTGMEAPAAPLCSSRPSDGYLSAAHRPLLRLPRPRRPAADAAAAATMQSPRRGEPGVRRRAKDPSPVSCPLRCLCRRTMMIRSS